MKLYQVDAFTREAFKGNPAGVWVGETFPPDAFMQSIAAEINASETAFVQIGKSGYAIRYFTPTREVPLCGHATLASAHILRELGIVAEAEPFVLRAARDNLTISVEGGWVKMLFPVYALSRLDDRKPLERALGARVIEAYGTRDNWIVARLPDEQSLLECRPDFAAIQESNIDILAATAQSASPAYDFSVRVFCNPSWGIREDPVTGSANCILAPYWQAELNKTSFASRQLSQRGGELKVRLCAEGVEIMGQARTVFVIEADV